MVSQKVSLLVLYSSFPGDSRVPSLLKHLVGHLSIATIRAPTTSSLGRTLALCTMQGLRAIPHLNRVDVVLCTSFTNAILLLPLKMVFRSALRAKLIVFDIAVPRVISHRHRFGHVFLKILLSGADSVVCHASRKVIFWKSYVGLKCPAYFVTDWLRAEVADGGSADLVDLGLEENNYVISVGRGSRDLGTLIRAFDSTAIPLLLIIGSDVVPHHADMRYGLDTASLPKNVRVLYDVRPEDVRALTLSARFVVLALKDLPFASGGTYVVMEAMSLGKAVVTSCVDQTLDYVEDFDTGIFTKPGDPQDLREKAVLLWNNPEIVERLGRNARDRASRFTGAQASKELASVVLSTARSGKHR